MAKNEQPIIFTTPEFAEQGKNLAEQTGGEFGNDFLQNERFRDDWTHGHIRDVTRSVQDRHVLWLSDFSRPENFFQNMAIPAAMAAYGARILHVICPFFPVGTMERVEKEGDIVTAIIMMRFFGNLPQADERKNRLTIFDIHQLGERHYLPREMAWRGLSWMQHINEKLPEDAVIAFPDEGAGKRFGKMFPGKRIVEFKKMRNKKDPTGKKKDLTVIEGDEHIKNENVYLIDDLIMTGGTSMEGGRILFDSGANTVTAVAPHPVFPDNNFDEFLGTFDAFITSDTLPIQAAKLAKNTKVTVHSIVPILAESLNS